MAERNQVKNKLFMREFNSGVKGRQFMFYDDVDEAVQDEDPRLKSLVYQANIELLGEIRTVLVPLPGEATRVVVSAGEIKDKKKK